MCYWRLAVRCSGVLGAVDDEIDFNSQSKTMIDLLNTIPAVVRILFVFVLIVFLIKRHWSLGNAFVCGSVTLGVIFGMNPLAILKAIALALAAPKTLSLAVVVSLILVLSHSLEKSGQMGRLLENYKGLVRRPRLNLVIFPALIGLLPMPGGAIFSAPMVKNLGAAHELSGAVMSYINYWFRHIWEYWWPLYPGILLTTALAGIDLWRLVAYSMPLTLVAVAAGYWPLRGNTINGRDAAAPKPLGPFLKELAPILFVIVCGVALGSLFSALMPPAGRPVAKELGLILALMAAIVWVWRLNRMPPKTCATIVIQPAMLKMVYMVAGILIFKGTLEDSGAVSRLSQEMLAWEIPLVPIAMLLPFIVGLVGGITIAFVGATFPILVSLVHSLGQSELMLPYMMLGLVCGFAGVLVSPLHLCLLLSNEYFQTSLTAVYRCLRLPVLALVAGGTLYCGVLSWWMG
jgi:integral membrane protein (TIGR00529 family)